MLALVVLICSFLVQLYLFLPTVNFGYSGLIFTLTVSFIAAGATSFYTHAQNSTPKQRQENKVPGTVYFSVAAVIVILSIMLSLVFTMPILHSSEYRDLLGKVNETKYNKDLPPIDLSNAPLVSEHMAVQVAQKKLSEISALGSQVVLGKFTKQSIRGKLYWVAFLEHSGFFKWSNTGYTPGYIKVSATNVEDSQLVTELNNKPLRMRYLESSYFGDNAERRIYYSGNENKGITELSTELDDEGNPYIVATLYNPTIGFSGDDVLGVAILDVQTGLVENYNIKDVPGWVDRVVPEEFVKEQINDWGQYVHGYWNLSDKDRLKISGNVDLVYGSDGFCYFYAGITSIGADNGIVGFMLVNSRTKESRIYKVAGANEDVAAKTAEDVIPEKHYHATSPLPFTVDETPTYIMTLTDDNGIARSYGMVSILNYQILAVSDSLKSTLRLYETKLASKGVNPAGLDVKSSVEKVIGRIVRFSSDTRQGTTSYYLMIEGSPHIFTANSDVSEKLILSKPGDHVSIVFSKGENKISTINIFDNLEIH